MDNPVQVVPSIVPQRRREWDGVAAVIAALVGLLALCVSGYTAYVQRQQVRAQVWPYLETGLSPSKQELTLVNKGVGPALIRSVQIFVDDKPLHDWDAVYAALGLKYAQRPPYSTINGVVISAGERIDQVVFKDADSFNLYVRQAKRVSVIGMRRRTPLGKSASIASASGSLGASWRTRTVTGRKAGGAAGEG